MELIVNTEQIIIMRLKYYLYTILASVILLMTACSPDKDGLGGIDVTPEQLAAGKGFSIDVNQETNQVTFKSLMPSSYSVYWEYGPMPADGADASISGTSTNSTYSLGIAFDGQYYVRMGVQTRGGIVFSERAPFSIDKMNVALLSDPLWTSLTGGVGSSKTWVLDIDASGTSVYFGGPKWFYTTGANWNNFHDAKGANYVDSKSWDASTAIEPSSDWYWKADWASNQWICGLADYGTMTFNLDGGANVEVNGNNGAFNMDVDNHTITFTGVLPLAIDQNAVANQCPSGTYKIIYLSENAMQILFDGPNETPFSLNYVAKDYKDNYVPPVDNTIVLPIEWKNVVLPFNQKVQTFKFDEDAPYSYFTLSGTEISNGFAVFKPHPDLGDAEILINQNTGVITIMDPFGNKTEATYSVSDGEETTDENGNQINKNGGVFTLSSMPEFQISTNADVKFGSKDKTLQVLKYETSSLTGDLTDLWVGAKQYDAQGNAYAFIAYHLVKQVAGGAVESYTASLYYAAQEFNFLPTSELVITGEGTYTISVVPDGVQDTKAPHLMYLDIAKLLKKHPNADIVINSVKVDGNELIGNALTDSDITRTVGDDSTTGRRYILNPWGNPDTANGDTRNYNYETLLPKFAFDDKIEVTFTVKYDVGEPVLK